MRSPAQDDNSSQQPEILSLDEFNVAIPQDVYDHLSKQYSALDNGDAKHINRMLKCMKKSPADTCCRVNNIQSSAKEVKGGLEKYFAEIMESHNKKSYSIQQHETLTDLVTIRATDLDTSGEVNLYCLKAPPRKISSNCNLSRNEAAIMDENKDDLFPNWQLRHEQGWPLTHRCIIVDRFCAEAVLRGSDIFVKGILCADAGIRNGEEVAVYANLPRSNNSTTSKPITRGMLLQNYCDRCVFIGIGISQCKRAHYFAQTLGLGVVMISTAGYPQPPLNGVLVGKMILQNLPSVVVAHALNPQPGEVVLDMCCAPGGKTTHLASLMNDDGLIIACDKSRKKMISTRDFFQANASCIVPLALDSTKALLALNSEEEWKSPKEIIDSAPFASDGLKDVNGFYPNSFDRILLDPPCSALGLRPKLQIDTKSLKELLKAADYQRKFICNAIPLLKVGGSMTYSTCTINASENEEMVKFILEEFACMRLESLSHLPGLPGLPDKGLTEEECQMVRRYDPTDTSLDTMGFFVAKFQKVC